MERTRSFFCSLMLVAAVVIANCSDNEVTAQGSCATNIHPAWRGPTEEARSTQYKVLLDECTALIKRFPRAANLYSDRGVLHRNAGDYKSALADFNEAIRIYGRNQFANNAKLFRAQVYERMGNLEAAIADYKEIGWTADVSRVEQMISRAKVQIETDRVCRLTDVMKMMDVQDILIGSTSIIAKFGSDIRCEFRVTALNRCFDAFLMRYANLSRMYPKEFPSDGGKLARSIAQIVGVRTVYLVKDGRNIVELSQSQTAIEARIPDLAAPTLSKQLSAGLRTICEISAVSDSDFARFVVREGLARR